jgi:citrate lyase subunit beta/citryl-CoA lyase
MHLHPFRAAQEIGGMSQPRSWLFVPADSDKKIAKALACAADAIIFDLEDSVAPERKAAARELLKGLGKREGGPQWWVRINPLRSDDHRQDLDVIGIADVHGIVLPKAESGADVIELAHRTGDIPIHAIVTETAASLFGLLSYRDPKSPLAAMSWGAEDLSAALGATAKIDADGGLSFTYRMARSLCLAGAVAAGVQPVDGVFAIEADDLRTARPSTERRGDQDQPCRHLPQRPPHLPQRLEEQPLSRRSRPRDRRHGDRGRRGRHPPFGRRHGGGRLHGRQLHGVQTVP